jgi:hypothetical protein
MGLNEMIFAVWSFVGMNMAAHHVAGFRALAMIGPGKQMQVEPGDGWGVYT